MWWIAYDCFLNTFKKKSGGLRTDLEELATDGAIMLMDKIKNGTKSVKDWKVESLPTCVYYICLKLLYSDKQKRIDKEISLEDAYIQQ